MNKKRWRHNISKAMMGHKLSDRTKEKIAEIRRGKKHSPETINKIKRSLKSGPDHPEWKGGKSTERSRLMKSADYILFRKEVYKRDGYVCQMPGCDRATTVLNCHHIERYADNKERVLDQTNGITLCRNCHKKVHSIEKEYEALFKKIVEKNINNTN